MTKQQHKSMPLLHEIPRPKHPLARSARDHAASGSGAQDGGSASNSFDAAPEEIRALRAKFDELNARWKRLLPKLAKSHANGTNGSSSADAPSPRPRRRPPTRAAQRSR